MAEIPDICEFEIAATDVTLHTRTNGDDVTMHVALGKEMAASLAYMINTDNHLLIEIKIKPH